ncbi:MAG: hypothetical protein LC643_08310 [Bacteroidales bacterium]|nr:hypothetical protein [Bacteroidales bacterium]
MQESMARPNDRISQKMLIGYGLDRQKVEGLLGLEVRKALSAQIEDLRTALGQFLQSKYLKTLPDDYLHNTEPLKLEGDSSLSTILSNLFVAPSDMDRHLRLPQQQKVEDKWQHWILALLDPESQCTDVAQTGIKSQAPDYEQMDPLHALASGGQKLEKGMEKEMDIAVKLAIVTDASLGFLSKQIFDTRLSGGKTYRTVAGPIGALAAGVGFGLVILAMHLSDSELEQYFKHFPYDSQEEHRYLAAYTHL